MNMLVDDDVGEHDGDGISGVEGCHICHREDFGREGYQFGW